MKKALIITTNFNSTFHVRIRFLEVFLQKKGYECLILAGNFDHRKKVKYVVDHASVVQLDVPEYKKNLSWQRIFSHYVFSKKSLDFCKDYEPDLIYAITPPNYIFHFLKKYKKNNRKVRLIYDIMDLWPESLPFSVTVKRLATPFTNIWAGIRNRNINCADHLVYECDLYQSYLQKNTKIPGKIIYLTKEQSYYNPSDAVLGDVLRYAYLGSINNIIDIDLIIEILKISAHQIPTELHIIGGGEKTEVLLDGCQKNGISVINHGVIYDNTEKERIFNQCHLALNIMKPTVYVGVTMKSLEYFHFGMPVINSIKADTAEFIEKFQCGFNVTDKQTLEAELSAFISGLNTEKLQEMSKNSRAVYQTYFSPEVFRTAIDDVIE